MDEKRGSLQCFFDRRPTINEYGLPRFFFGYFLCSDDKESNNKRKLTGVGQKGLRINNWVNN